jgi:phosphopantothenoylcysteine decarboxylase/phosphopantothenate--cysteine ligase
MACGEFGPGRMAEPMEIVAAIEQAPQAPPLALRRPTMPPPGSPGRKPLAGRHVLITSGPTHEPIDPVRYIANRSSGKQGHAIAAAAAEAGARVTLVSGPVTIPDPAGVTTVHVESARDMRAAVEAACRPISPFSPPPSPTGASPPRPRKRSRRARRSADAGTGREPRHSRHHRSAIG